MSLDFVPPVEFNPKADPNAGVFPRFYVKPMPDGRLTEQEGRPMFRDVEMIEIRIAGDKTTVIDTKVSDEHRNRWPQHYDAFKKGQTRALVGTPVEEWPVLTPSKVAELKALNIFTVEALAEMPDTGLARMGMGARELQDKAKAWIDSAKGGAASNQIIHQNEQLKMRVEMLEQQIRELGSQPEEKTRRGRKKAATA